MLKAVEDISTTKKRLKIEIPSETIENMIRDSLEKVRQKAKIPGFRPGKTPMGIIEKRFGKDAEAEAVEKLIPEFYEQALKEADIVPVAKPALDGELNFARHNPISLTVTVEVRPKIERLNYKNIAVKDIPITVSDLEIEAALRHLQEEKATYKLEAKEIEIGDMVTVDYEIKYDDQIMSEKDHVLKAGLEGLPIEIAESIRGKKAGDTAEAETLFPEDFNLKALAGKKAIVKNVIKGVKKKNLPEVDVEFAKDMGHETLDGLREEIREKIAKSKKEQAARAQKDELLGKLITAHEFDVPDAMLQSELSLMINEVKSADKSSDGTDAELGTELKPAALKTVKALILLSVIGEKENITVTEAEIKDRILEMARQFSIPPESLLKIYIQRYGSLEGLKSFVYEQKVLDLLLSNAIIEKGE